MNQENEESDRFSKYFASSNQRAVLDPSTKNDYLSSIEAKRQRLALDRKSLHDLERRVEDYLTD